jgi:filamentous hemagglutinin
MSNAEVRWWYLEQEAKIPQMIDKTAPLEQQAKQAFDLRNAFRSTARDAMIDQKAADMLRISEPNLTWEQAVQKYSVNYSGDDVWKQIIEASMRSRSSVNQSLGIKP